MVGDDLVRRLRMSLAVLVAIHIVITTAAAWRAAPGATLAASATTPLAVSASCWLVYLLLPAHKLAWLSQHDALELTAEGLRYDEVETVKGISIERYRGLAATRAEGSEHELEQRALQGGIGGCGAKYKLAAHLLAKKDRRASAAAAGFLAAVVGNAEMAPAPLEA